MITVSCASVSTAAMWRNPTNFIAQKYFILLYLSEIASFDCRIRVQQRCRFEPLLLLLLFFSVSIVYKFIYSILSY